MKQEAVSLTRQGKNYVTLFWRLMRSYYRHEKLAFWLVQILMGASVVLSLIWLLGLIAGLNQLHDSHYLDQYETPFIALFFNQPVPVWLSVLSIAGVFSALCLYVSYQIGVSSAIRYQKCLITESLSVVNNDDQFNWVRAFSGNPRHQLNRIIKMGVQLTGLVARRVSRVFVPLVTFVVAFVALILLDGQLLLYLMPLTITYIVALYFINRYAARIQVKLSELIVPVNSALTQLIDSVLDNTGQKTGMDYAQNINKSAYQDFSNLRYQRRLAEVHVGWLNTLFLVFASAVLVLVFKYVKTEPVINWMNLIVFLVALRYAASGLQQVSATTVGFSRFLPEIEKVLRLLYLPSVSETTESRAGTIFCLTDDFQIKGFEQAYLKSMHPEHQMALLEELIDSSVETVERYIHKYKNGLIVSNRPKRFLNRVRQHSGLITYVLLIRGGKAQYISDIEGFIDTFKVDDFLQDREVDDMNMES